MNVICASAHAYHDHHNPSITAISAWKLTAIIVNNHNSSRGASLSPYKSPTTNSFYYTYTCSFYFKFTTVLRITLVWKGVRNSGEFFNFPFVFNTTSQYLDMIILRAVSGTTIFVIVMRFGLLKRLYSPMTFWKLFEPVMACNRDFLFNRFHQSCRIRNYVRSYQSKELRTGCKFM